MGSNIISPERSVEINNPNYIYTCTKCGIPQPNTEYSRDKHKGKGRGYVTQCKECRRIYNRTPEAVARKREMVPIRRKKNRLNIIYWSSVTNAKGRNWDHSITQEYILELYNKQKGLCYYTNKPMLIDITNEETNNDSASIDRIDSTKGYIVGNIALCRWKVNKMKNDLSTEDFIKTASEIYFNFKDNDR